MARTPYVRILRTLTTGIVAGTVLALFALPAQAAAGDLDPTWGTGGIVTTNPGHHGWGNQIAIQPDGKVIVVGFDGTGSVLDFAVVRYNTDGSLDSTFGNGGIVTTDFGGGTKDFARAVALQPNGKIVVGGEAGYDYGLARYNPDGTLDTTFGPNHNGKVTLNIFGEDAIRAVLIRNDGKIVTVGFSGRQGTHDFSIARFRPSGILDTSFATNGTARTDLGGEDQARGAAITTGGRIVVTGYYKVPSTHLQDIAMVRYTPGGLLDTTFGPNGTGWFTTDLGQSEVARALVVQPDNKIVVGAYIGSGGGLAAPNAGHDGDEEEKGNADFLVLRYTSNGALDTTFGPDQQGFVVTDIGGPLSGDHIRGIALQADGKIVAAGNSPGGTVDDFALARYNLNGTLDATFGNGGIVTTDFGGADGARDVKIQADGKILAAGIASSPLGSLIAVGRYEG